jgi:L-ascorbate metabolism protein UlaG (beta-lactamase superfamily)
MMPNEIIQAAKDLNTKVLLPVHWSKFTLALHPWNEPIKELSKFAKAESMPLCTPLIGELVKINETYPDSVWWEF